MTPDKVAAALANLPAEDFADHSKWLQIMQATAPTEATAPRARPVNADADHCEVGRDLPDRKRDQLRRVSVMAFVDSHPIGAVQHDAVMVLSPRSRNASTRLASRPATAHMPS
ncbi:hypothetical protein QCM80_42465 [Bradyrhizobium sp. SSUT112]|uniref:hypothetical protein n=1 Tax=Bradyrhizobium sp. SSUT112 TaxID=3040604 RepID=UPI002447F87A|nr:hypothetical protein [Bradyrhizobium sp. SSUT112]MDH2357203.1 hypothetical protein [Bradyrhizobium sp. SSUT112]